MKKKIGVALVLASLVAGISYAQQQVTSVNAVGYVKVDLFKGKLHLLCLNFDPVNGNYAVSNLFPAATCGMPSGTKIYRWNPAGQTYFTSQDTLVSVPSVKWNPGTNAIQRGEAFWVQIPASAAQSNYTLYVMGEVPTVSTDTTALASGFSVVGFPYPVDYLMTNTPLNSITKSGDKLYQYNPTNATAPWKVYTYVTIPSPRWNPGTFVFTPGNGVFLQRSTVTNWNQPRPYSW